MKCNGLARLPSSLYINTYTSLLFLLYLILLLQLNHWLNNYYYYPNLSTHLFFIIYVLPK